MGTRVSIDGEMSLDVSDLIKNVLTEAGYKLVSENKAQVHRKVKSVIFKFADPD
jgi:hypothetical protein